MPSRPELTTDPARAAQVLAEGGLVALPTETVYGLAARADRDEAVSRIYQVKGRPVDHPLIVHVADASELARWASQVPRTAATLAELCWPGPLTLVVPAAAHVSRVVTAGRDTVAVRVPAQQLTLTALRLLGTGVAAPSANRFGRVSPTTAAHVVADLGAEVDLVLDGGPCEVGLESTIVDCTVEPPQVLRPGGLPVDDLERLLRAEIAPPSGPSRAPGMLASHYAPQCRVHPVETATEADVRAASLASRGSRVEVLDPGSDLVAYAKGLYGWLRDADDRALTDLVVVLPPAAGLGHAIRDRVVKAGHRPAGQDRVDGGQ
jgi:L-threonylcarbamoyladenylate synthase